MLHIRMSDESREGKEHFRKLDMADYAKKSFGMFGGKEQKVKLLVDNSLAGVIIDRFGKEVMMIPADPEHFTVNVTVMVSSDRHGQQRIPRVGLFPGRAGEDPGAGGSRGEDAGRRRTAGAAVRRRVTDGSGLCKTE